VLPLLGFLTVATLFVLIVRRLASPLVALIAVPLPLRSWPGSSAASSPKPSPHRTRATNASIARDRCARIRAEAAGRYRLSNPSGRSIRSTDAARMG